MSDNQEEWIMVSRDEAETTEIKEREQAADDVVSFDDLETPTTPEPPGPIEAPAPPPPAVVEESVAPSPAPTTAVTVPEVEAPPPVEQAQPKMIGCYTILEPLGEGGQGKLFTCKDQNGTIFAIKSIECQDIDEALEQARSKKALLHNGPHINNVVDILSDSVEKKVYYITRYLPEGDLGRCIRNAKQHFPEDVILSAFLQFLSAINFIHNKGIVHMDVKPENILVERKESDPSNLVLHLTDFDVCRKKGVHSNVTCDYAYTAPEVLKSGSCTPAADVFSLGVTLLMFALLPEFPDLDGDVLCADRWSDQIALTDEVSASFDSGVWYSKDGRRVKYSDRLISLICRMLQHDAARRPSFLSLSTA
eukprot:TRINITY_DN2732_c0_g1_i2.p1 TRINITY_DN2732_c0_g1~~TRINITY_DN2732_c0_g1_i2.p1  ORF type:complete len:364 (+),score=96.88 TRINITY_DN2732_c0_g1_i2:60-1151(+)